ncbi:hypothetical protein F652_1115 [Enterobacteriaceae bacterium bta3-1]|nr:hypothetical protein F652_1115 [Enterobacteriaceae bacterium bta3-1]
MKSLSLIAYDEISVESFERGLCVETLMDMLSQHVEIKLI